MESKPLQSLTAYGLSRALYAITQLQPLYPVPHALCSNILQAVEHHLTNPAELQAQTVAHILWALSKLQLYDEGVFDAAVACVPALAPTFNVIDVSNSVHALARTYSRLADALPEGMVNIMVNIAQFDF